MKLPKHGYHFTIDLTQGKQAIVDEKDWHALRKCKWYALYNTGTKTFYAARKQRIKGKQRTVRMHREILGLGHGDPRLTDHKNHDTLDNRCSNIRITDNRGNMNNRKDQSKHGVGVEQGPRNKRSTFTAHVRHKGKKHHLGAFTSTEEAQAARQEFLANLP